MKKMQIAALACVCLFPSCKIFHSEQKAAAPLLSIDGTDIYEDEFVYVFNKNNYNDSAVTYDDLEAYLELFIRFKLKIHEARSLGLHNTHEFSQEFESYRDELIKPFLTESKVNDSLVSQAYERLKTEVNASHILIEVSENASPEDTLRAYERILAIREKIVAGEDFNALAREYSEDPSAVTNGGNLGYFTALQMVYPFEEMAYATNAGDVSPVFRTRFGYHILKVHDKRPSAGKIKVSHIMIRSPFGTPAEDSLAAVRKIRQIYDELEKGGLWFDLCGQFSEDLSTRSSGGALPWFGTGSMPTEFEQAAFALHSIGAYSQPVRTAYGWHIIKLDGRQELEPFEEIRESLLNRIKRDSRSELSRRALVERLKRENNFRENASALEELFAAADASLAKGNWDYKPERDFEIFRINDSVFVASGFIDFVAQKNSPVQISPDQHIRNLYREYVDREVVQYEKNHLAEKNFDYKMLLKEYEEGILLFQLMDDKIWSQAIRDSVGLQSYYEEHRERYKQDHSVKAVIFNAASREIRDELKPFLSQPYIPAQDEPILVRFADGGRLTEEIRRQLDSLVLILKRHEKWVVELSSGNEISVVNDYLTSAGIDSGRIIPGTEERQKDVVKIRLLSASRKLLERRFNDDSGLNLTIEEGTFERDQLPGDIKWEPGLYEVDSAGRFYLVEVKDTLPPEYRKLEDIRGLVISDYQDFLELKWIAELKAKYPVTINETRKKKLFKKLVEI